jgi:hypothetical protein
MDFLVSNRKSLHISESCRVQILSDEETVYIYIYIYIHYDVHTSVRTVEYINGIISWK